jgi:predicted lactoylglutathione lyase
MRQKINIITLGVRDYQKSLHFFEKGLGWKKSSASQDDKEVDAVLKQVEKLGAKIIKPAQKVFWGGYSGYFQDLDNHLWEVTFNPFVKFDENDNLILE